MLEEKKTEEKTSSKSNGNLFIVYPHDINSQVSPAPILSFFKNEETFHTSMKIYLTIAQFFSLFPIAGVSGPRASSLHFSFWSWRSFYAMLIIALNLAHNGVILFFNIRTGCTFDKMFPLIWFTVNPFTMYQFIRIAQKWQKLMLHWESFELSTTYKDIKIHKKMRKIVIITSIGIPTLGFVEHLFSLGNNLITARQCKKASDTMTAYFKGAFPAFFYFFEVDLFSGICMQIINLYATFAWSMTDSFIVLVSLGLITQLQHFNAHFEKYRAKNFPPEFWGKQRFIFTKLTELLDHVNNDLAVLILTSFSVNTFYICVQLYGSVTPIESSIRQIYFWYSTIYLIGKTFAVSMVATFINDEARKPIAVLNTVPASVYGSEAARFMSQLTTGTIALGGMQFFYITRAFLISMAGTIITYEIILMQLKTQHDPNVDPCEG